MRQSWTPQGHKPGTEDLTVSARKVLADAKSYHAAASPEIAAGSGASPHDIFSRAEAVLSKAAALAETPSRDVRMSQCRTPLSGIRTSRADGGLRASFAPASDAGTSSDQPSRWQELRKIAAQQDNLQSLAVAQSIVAGDLRSSSSHGLAPPVQTLLTPSRPSALGCGGSILDAATPSAGRASSSRLEDLVARHRSASLGVGGTHSGSGAAALRGSLSDDSSLGLEAHRLLQRAFVTAKTSETAAFMARPHSAGGGSDGELELQLAMTQIRSAFAAATLSSSSSAAAHPETPATLVAAGGRPSSAPGSAAGQRGRQAPPVASPALRASLSRTPLAAGAVSTPRGTSLAQQLQTKQAEAARVKELASKLRLLKLRRLLPAWRAAAAKLLHDRRVVQHAASQLRRRKAARLLLAWRRAAAASAADRRQRELAELTDARRKLQVAASFHCMFVAHLALRKWKSYARASRQFKQEQARQMAQAERAGEAALRKLQTAERFRRAWLLHSCLVAWRQVAHALAHERSYERQEAARKSRIQQFLTNVSISQRARRDPVAAAAVLAAAGSEYLPAAAQAAALENVAAAAAAPGGSSGGAAHLVYVVTPEVILPQALPASEAAATAAAAASVLPLSSPPQMEPLTGSGGRDRAPSNAQLHPADTPTSVCDGVCDAPAPCEPEASREGPSAGCETAVATSNSPEDLQAAGEEASAESVRDGDPTSSSSNNNGSGGGGDAHLPAAKRPRLQTSAASEAREVAAARAAAAEQYRKQLEHARAAELRRRKQYESDVMAIESALRMQAARLAAAHRAQRLLRRCMSAWEQSVGRSRAAAEACDARWSRKLAKRALLGLKTTMWRAVWRRVTAEAVALGRAKAHHAARLQLAALGWLWTWSRASRMGRAVRQRPALEALRSAAQARAEAMQLAAAHHRAATLAVLVQAWRGAAAAEAQAREQKEQQRLQWAARLHSGRLLRCVLTAWWRQAQDGRLERQQRAAQEQTWSKINGWLDELRQQRGEDYLTPAAALRELTLDDLAPAPPVAAGAALGASRRSGASALADFDLGEPLKALDLPPLSFGGPTSLVFSAAAEAKSAAASKARTAPSTAIPTAAAGNSIFDAVSDFGLDIMKPWSLDERRELASESQPAAASVAVAASLAAALSPGPVLPLAAGKSSSRRSTAESDDVAAAQFKDQQPLLPSRASFSSVDGGCLGSKAPGGSLGTPLQVGGSNSISSDAAAASAARQQALSRFLDAKLQQHQGLRPLN